MDTTQFKNGFFIERVYQPISETEFKCRLIIKSKANNKEITGIETKINTVEIGQGLANSQFSVNPINWKRYLNQTITMLFNMLMLRLNITDLYYVDGEDEISEFFNENPFYKKIKKASA